VLNPSDSTFESAIRLLLNEAYDLAVKRYGRMQAAALEKGLLTRSTPQAQLLNVPFGATYGWASFWIAWSFRSWVAASGFAGGRRLFWYHLMASAMFLFAGVAGFVRDAQVVHAVGVAGSALFLNHWNPRAGLLAGRCRHVEGAEVAHGDDVAGFGGGAEGVGGFHFVLAHPHPREIRKAEIARGAGSPASADFHRA
jgi:hypothetical protein